MKEEENLTALKNNKKKDIELEEEVPQSNRNRLKSILKKKDPVADNIGQGKTVRFSQHHTKVHEVKSYKKYNSFNEKPKKPCCWCIIF